MIGDARIVALGENTRGTRDFFEMKTRVLRFLVEEMGFRTFAMQVNWPEARRVDRYVRTGQGDPDKLLAGLYHWWWNTESVLEVIEWMREHNAAGGDVGFAGFDMLFSGMPLHNLRLFLREVEPVAADKVTVQLNCLGRFANGPDGWRSFPEYDDQSSEYHAACGAALNETWDGFLLMRDKYEALVGEEDYEVALQNLRLAVQYHLWTADERGRGESMAENVEWIRRRSGPQHRILLWADNYHASTEPGGMGAHLREAFGDEFLTVGCSHERGRFVGVYRSETPNPGFAAFDLDAPIAGSFEHYLSSASYPQFLLDLRDLDAIQVGGARFAETRAFRFIGINYEPAMPESFWVQTPLSDWYDVLIHVKTTRPSVVLPLRFPHSF